MRNRKLSFEKQGVREPEHSVKQGVREPEQTRDRFSYFDVSSVPAGSVNGRLVAPVGAWLFSVWVLLTAPPGGSSCGACEDSAAGAFGAGCADFAIFG